MIYIAMCRFPLCARSVSLARRMTRWRGERQKSLHYGGANCPSPPGMHDLHARTHGSRHLTTADLLFFRRLRKVKMDQRKLMDNASTITDMAKVSEPGTY